MWIAGSRPRYLDFHFAPWGLEGVSVEHPTGATAALFVLGPPSCIGDGRALWRRRNVIISIVGSSIFLAEPGSDNASLLERFGCFAR